MPAAGRNDPCPCGSGKKYKHCCLARAQAATGITARDRTEAMNALARYTRREEFAAVVGEAALLWAADDFGDAAEAALESIIDEETSLQLFFEWLFFDLALEDGRTLSQLYLDVHARQVSPRAADYIRLMQGTHLRPFQIRRVRLDAGLEVRDLWNGEELFIDERAATHELVIWDILVARVVAHADGTQQIEGTLMVLPPGVETDLVKTLKHEHRAFLRAIPDGTDAAFFKQHVAPVFHDLWHEQVSLDEPPELRTPEGDAVTTSRLVFDVPQAEAAVAALAREPDFEFDGDHGCVWLQADTEPRRLLGEVSGRDDTLSLVTFSRERAARGRARLEAALGPLRLRSEDHQEVGSGTLPDDWADEETEDAFVEPEQLAEVHEWLARKDREWLDLEIPALDGRTPREAARNKRLRPRLRSLLIEMENREARMAAPGPGRDITWMWQELRLKRP